eukprot:IDg22834t1
MHYNHYIGNICADELAFRRALGNRTVKSTANTRNDIYTVPEAFTLAGNRSTLTNSSTTTRSRTALTAESDEPQVSVETYKQLYNLFLSKAEMLTSDEAIVENGTLKGATKSGATLVNANVIAALRIAE